MEGKKTSLKDLENSEVVTEKNEYEENFFDIFNLFTDMKNPILDKNTRDNIFLKILNIKNETKSDENLSHSKVKKVNLNREDNEIIPNINKSEKLFENEHSTAWNSKDIPKKRKYFRVDDAKIHFKVAINKFALNKLNSMIKKSCLSNKLKKKFHVPNYTLFTSNVRELDNSEFLSYQLKDILTIGKEQNFWQGNNYYNIQRIFNNRKFPEETKKIKDFLNLTYEDIIRLFYESENFQKFKDDELTEFFDEGIKKEKNICLLKDYGLIKLFKMTNKKRKREIFSIHYRYN